MLLTTPHTIRTLQRKLYAKAKPNTANVACSKFECAGATACYVRRSPVTDGVAYPMNGESEGRRAA
jgi:hypothetical protein